jgi:predicted ester cyclase
MNTTTNSPILIDDLAKHPAIQFLFAYQEQDIDGMLALCHPAGTVHFRPLGDHGRGRLHELGRDIWSSIVECFPDITNTVDAATREPDGSVRAQVLISGTQAKDFAGITSQGLRFSSDHVFIFQLDPDDRITDLQVEWDHADFSRQLGA